MAMMVFDAKHALSFSQLEQWALADTGTMHKQKLDCALQLARSVALDFNNALTSILGHASLLLSKAEAGHPWRSSLNEIEKSAAKAAEIKRLVQEKLWDPAAQFFKVLPRRQDARCSKL